MSLTEITGEVSVRPYPSTRVIPAAVKIRASRGCKAALPEAMSSKLPPKASCHFDRINFLAILSLNSYQAPFCP